MTLTFLMALLFAGVTGLVGVWPMTNALFDSPGKTLLLDREPPEPPRRRQCADIAAQGKCLAVLQRAGQVVHVGKSGT